MTAIVSDWAISWTGGRQPQPAQPPDARSATRFYILFQSCRCPGIKSQPRGKFEFPSAIIGVGRVAVKGQSPS